MVLDNICAKFRADGYFRQYGSNLKNIMSKQVGNSDSWDTSWWKVKPGPVSLYQKGFRLQICPGPFLCDAMTGLQYRLATLVSGVRGTATLTWSFIVPNNIYPKFGADKSNGMESFWKIAVNSLRNWKSYAPVSSVQFLGKVGAQNFPWCLRMYVSWGYWFRIES